MAQFCLVLLSLLFTRINCQEERIANGKMAREGQFPYQVQFRVEVSDIYNGPFCSGALISNQWILSAYHCFSKDQLPPKHITYSVYLGSVDSISNQSTMLKIDGYFQHPNSSFTNKYKNYSADIILLKLANPVTLSEHIQPIRLPDKVLAEDYFDGKSAVVSGFGLTETRNVSKVLLYANVTVISNKKCAKIFPEDPYMDETICTSPGDQGENPCNGDSGSPLAADVDGKPVLIGIVSRVQDNDVCGVKPSPVRYVRISHFLNWIQKTMAPN